MTYAYCHNNPVRYIDPTGMDWDNSKDKEFAERLSKAMIDRMDIIFGNALEKYGSYKMAIADGNIRVRFHH